MSTELRKAAAVRFAFRRGAFTFWLASLFGFVAYGHVVAATFLAGMPEARAPLAEWATTTVAVGLAGAIVLGAPAALLFAGVMQRVDRRRAWRPALVTAGVLSAALALALRALSGAVLAGWGYAGQPAVLLGAALAAMMAGAIGGTVAGRGGRGRS